MKVKTVVVSDTTVVKVIHYAEVVEAYKRLGSTREVGKELGLSNVTIGRVLKKAGFRIVLDQRGSLE